MLSTHRPNMGTYRSTFHIYPLLPGIVLSLSLVFLSQQCQCRSVGNNDNYIHSENGYRSNNHNRNTNGNSRNNNRAQDNSSNEPRIDPVLYLQKLGYFPGSDLETGALRTEEEFTKAVKKFQKFANVPLTGLLDEPTQTMMKKSRCGVQDVLDGEETASAPQGLLSSDPPSSTDAHAPLGYVLGPSKWQKRWITYRLLNFSGDLDRQKTKDAIRRAFNLWSDTANLSFEERETGYADIYILFAREYHQDGYPFDRLGGTLAHAFFPGEEKGGDVHFDDDEWWTLESTNGTNLFIVGAHEIGHALGLAHSYDTSSLMFPWYKGYTPDYRLSYDDIVAIQTIYGPKPRPKDTTDNKPSIPSPTTTTTTSTTTTTTTTTATTTLKNDVEPTTKYHHHHHHHHHDHHHHSTVKPPPGLEPEDCDLTVDAVSRIRSDYFFFKGSKFYRLNRNKKLTSKPIEIHRFWMNITAKLERVDAVFEKADNAFFFSGKKYWKYFGNQLDRGFPKEGRDITDFKLPPTLEKIDAAFTWDHNKRVYLISGDMYWRLDEHAREVDYGYPRDMSMWKGVKLPVDAAFTDSDGVTYFFNGPHFWAFNNARMQVRHKHPQETATHWLQCPPTFAKAPEPKPLEEQEPASQASSVFSSFSLLLIPFVSGYLVLI